jgi:hypothetical protein
MPRPTRLPQPRPGPTRHRPSFEKLAAAWALVLVCLAVMWVSLRPRAVSEEDRVRMAITEVAQGARAADLARTFAPVSEIYREEELTRDQIKAYVFGQFQKRGPVAVFLGPIDVTFPVEGRADAHFDAALAQGLDADKLDLMPDNADTYEFDVHLTNEQGQWRITGHEHRSRTGSPDLVAPR